MVQDEMKNINDCYLQCLPRCECPLLLSRQLILGEVDLVKIQVVRDEIVKLSCERANFL